MKVLKNFINEVFKESSFENENNQEIVPVEIESEDENNQTTSRAFPKCSIFSELLSKTLGRLMASPNSLKIKASSSGAIISEFLHIL